MDMEMMRRFFEDMEGQSLVEVSASDDPIGWVRAQLENNEELAFREEDCGVWKCSSLKCGRLVEATVSANEGKVSVVASIDVVPNEETELPIRIFQMAENGTIKLRGFLPARAGERISYGATHVIRDGFELNTLINRAIFSVAMHAAEIERINCGEAVESVYWREKIKRIRGARLLNAINL